MYTLKVCFIGHSSITPSPQNVLGLVSLIFWSLMLVVSFKYALFILKAEDDGEGGVFAMLALLHKKRGARLGRGLILAGLFGSALLYGDGLITPVISVLSALEGLEVATDSAKPLVVPLTCGILVLLFWAQSHGTGRIGKFFGPVMILWFAVIAVLGVAAISRSPDILAAVNPAHAVRFFLDNGIRGFFLLGAVVLCVTGCEALYADMGHFGTKAIRISWYFVALPALVLNYFGQGAVILHDPTNAEAPFFSLVPHALLYPMVLLSTMAAIIASQAIISGVFSLTRQAIQLGFLPRMRVVHTSGMAEGQVYLPDVNVLMMVAAIALTLYFKASDNLADAYGIAVTGTMLITSAGVLLHFQVDLGMERDQGPAALFAFPGYGPHLLQFLPAEIHHRRLVRPGQRPADHGCHGRLVGRLEEAGDKGDDHDRSKRKIHGKGRQREPDTPARHRGVPLHFSEGSAAHAPPLRHPDEGHV